MWVRIGKRLECDQPHEFVDFVSFFAQHSARNEAGLDVVAHREPWKKIRILKNETTLGARAEDFFFVHNQLAGIRKIETRDESKQCRFSATRMKCRRARAAWCPARLGPQNFCGFPERGVPTRP